MTDNPLVADPVDTTTAVSGTGIVESVADLYMALESGSWVAAGLSAGGLALDVWATVSDPLGSLIGAGIGWIIDHLEPLKGWLNDLTGDPGAVLGYAGTWENVAKAMESSGDEYLRIVKADLEGLSRQAITAYATYAKGLSEEIRAAGGAASSIASALKVCSTIVQVVHDVVRDALSQLAGAIISWVAEAVVTLGVATPLIVEQVTSRVSSLAARIGKSVADVLTSAKSLKELLEALMEALRALAKSIRSKLPGRRHAPDTPKVPDAPEVPKVPKRQWPTDPQPGTSEYDLGWDPAVGKFRPAEYQTATRIVDELGVNLNRAPKGSSADWVDDAGKTYDAVGGFPGRFLDRQWDNFTGQITRHLGKADLIPVDVSGFSADQILRIKEFIAPLGERVFLVGE